MVSTLSAPEITIAHGLATEWALKSRPGSDEFAMWCVVAAMYLTGLCAKCVVEDSSHNYQNCPNDRCSNHMSQ